MSSRKVREMIRQRRIEFDRRVAENRKNLEKISEPEEKAEDKAEEKPKKKTGKKSTKKAPKKKGE